MGRGALNQRQRPGPLLVRGANGGVDGSWDGTGPCQFAKCLEQGAFWWSKIEKGIMRLTPSQLSALIEGLDWMHVREVETKRPGVMQ